MAIKVVESKRVIKALKKSIADLGALDSNKSAWFATLCESIVEAFAQGKIGFDTLVELYEQAKVESGGQYFRIDEIIDGDTPNHLVNENYLAGMVCPRCFSRGPFRVAGTAFFVIEDSGSQSCDEIDFSNPKNMCSCQHCCDYVATVEDFKKAGQKWAKRFKRGK